jgi:hypothetical protein
MPKIPSKSHEMSPRQNTLSLILALSVLAPLEMGTVDCNNAKPKLEPSRQAQLERVANKTRYELAAKGFVEGRWGAERGVSCQELPENAVGLAREVLAEKNENGTLQDLSSMEKGVVCTIGNPDQDDSVMLGLSLDAKVMVAKK